MYTKLFYSTGNQVSIPNRKEIPMLNVTFEDIRNNEEIKTYISAADKALSELGYTEHSFAHVTRCAEGASSILRRLGYDQRECELAQIAGYIHDIGNIINRVDHAQSGAVTARIICAIGNHDESTGVAVSAISAALILADKSDVRRSRVRNSDIASFDIHDRVNFAVEKSNLELDTQHSVITLFLEIDTTLSSVMDYFEIFLKRMLLCRKAAEYLGLKFRLNINGLSML